MIDLEQQPEVLLDARSDPTQLTCLGVALGELATKVPRARVVEVTFSPLVKSLMCAQGEAPTYEGFDGQPVSPDLVYASVAHESGVLHTDADVSFTALGGQVQRFSLYGRWLSRFTHLDTPAKLHEAFGVPDRCLRLDADGDLIGYDSYYAAARKWVRWLCVTSRPSVVMFGGEANAVQAGERGGVSRA